MPETISGAFLKYSSLFKNPPLLTLVHEHIKLSVYIYFPAGILQNRGENITIL
jgi:hypothetical protein